MTDSRPCSYESAREIYRPCPIRTLFIAEAAPSDPERFFYFEKVRSHDALFWEMMKVIYGVARVDRPRNAEFLRRFKENGFFLIDACTLPLPKGAEGEAKKKAIRDSLNNLLNRSALNGPETKIILLCATVYDVCLEPLKGAGLNVINTEMIPHPACGHAIKFREKLSRLLK